MNARLRSAGIVAVALLALLPGAACIAPAMALIDVSTAQAELAAAETAGGPKWAPYEYTAAEIYLKQAKDRLGHSGSYYQESYEYAQKAYKFAHQAKQKAENHPKE